MTGRRLAALAVVTACATSPAGAATLLIVRADELGAAGGQGTATVAQGFAVDSNRLFGACAPLVDGGVAVWRSVDDSCTGWDNADPGDLPAMEEPVRGANGFRIEQVLALGQVVTWDTALRIACLPGACEEGPDLDGPPDALFRDAFED